MKKSFTPQSYRKRVDEVTPNSSLFKNIIRAFFFGGLICIVGELVMRGFKMIGAGSETASNLTVLVMIFIGATLTGLNVYDNIGKVAGAGSVVPITGFANSIVAPAMEFKSEGYVLGVGSRMFVVAGPVLVYGIVTSVLGGIFYYIFTGGFGG